MDINILNRTQAQIDECYEKYGSYASAHEALAIFIEEVEELKAEIFKKELNLDRMEAEIIDCLTVLLKMEQDIVKENNKR